MLEHFRYAELPVLGVTRLLPQRAAPIRRPCVELDERAEALLARIDPDASPAHLHVLLDPPLLAAAGDIPEVGVMQVVRAHRSEARVGGAALAVVQLVDRRLHVVADAASGHPAQGREAQCVGVEQHLVALAGAGHRSEGATRTQLHVQHLHPVIAAAHHQPLFAPVELECLATLEAQRHKGLAEHALALTAPPATEVGHARVAARVVHRLDLGVQRACRAPLAIDAMRIELQRLRERLVVRRQLGRSPHALVLRYSLHRLVQPLRHRVARQPHRARYVALRVPPPRMHPPNPANHFHGDHSSSSAA